MKQKLTLPTALVVLSALSLIVYSCRKNDKSEESKEYTAMNATPDNGAFQSHRDSVPSQEEYSNPLFELSHDYPTKVKDVVNPSWQ